MIEIHFIDMRRAYEVKTDRGWRLLKQDNIIVVVIANASYRRPGQDQTQRREAISLAIAESCSCRAHTLNIIMEMLRAIGEGYLIFQTGDSPYAALARYSGGCVPSHFMMSGTWARRSAGDLPYALARQTSAGEEA